MWDLFLESQQVLCLTLSYVTLSYCECFCEMETQLSFFARPIFLFGASPHNLTTYFDDVIDVTYHTKDAINRWVWLQLLSLQHRDTWRVTSSVTIYKKRFMFEMIVSLMKKSRRYINEPIKVNLFVKVRFIHHNTAAFSVLWQLPL